MTKNCNKNLDKVIKKSTFGRKLDGMVAHPNSPSLPPMCMNQRRGYLTTYFKINTYFYLKKSIAEM